MKKHAIIPIFIPHEGCPNDCIFCNQKKITARTLPPEPEQIRETIDTWLSTLTGRGLETVEIAFFGGSFTGLPILRQSEYLAVAKEYKGRGLVQKIHLSTRPDYISREILDNLRRFSVDIIELGVQSFDPEVLRQANRGHDVKSVYQACDLIKEYGFELGIQLMIGLPGDTLEKAIYSAKQAVSIGPKIARLYPTVVIQDTELAELHKRGLYKALTTEEAVAITKEMYKLLDYAGIHIIRVGLKSTDIINENGEITGGTFHPAFRQLVEGEIAREMLEAALFEACKDNSSPELLSFCSNSRCFSNMIGNRSKNRTYFAQAYPQIRIRYSVDNSLADGIYTVVKKQTL